MFMYRTLFMLSTSLVLAACQPAPQQINQMSVSSHAEVNVQPDQVKIQLNVIREGDELHLLKQQVDDVTAIILEAASQQQVANEDITSYQIQAAPRYDYPDGERVLRGYTVTRKVSLLLRDPASYDMLINEILEAGATHILNTEYIVSETEELYQQMLELALQRAREKAERMAQAANTRITGIINISESSQAPIRAETTMMMRQAADVSRPGTSGIRAQVQVTYRLE